MPIKSMIPNIFREVKIVINELDVGALENMAIILVTVIIKDLTIDGKMIGMQIIHLGSPGRVGMKEEESNKVEQAQAIR